MTTFWQRLSGGLIFVLWAGSAAGATFSPGFRTGDTLEEVTLAHLVAGIPRGSVVVLGEAHGSPAHRRQQVAVLEELRRQGHRVSVGLEFFEFPAQEWVDRWRDGQISEPDFLSAIDWGSIAFDFYREQARFPSAHEGATTLAINAPRALVRRVGQVGLAGLRDDERSLLPPGFQVGRESYRERFFAQVPHAMDPVKMENYFAAQSVWDDFMAWRAVEFMKSREDDTLVIVVGEFHAAYGGGLPDRLRSRLPAPVTVISMRVEDSEIAPHPKYGPRAEHVWIGPWD